MAVLESTLEMAERSSRVPGDENSALESVAAVPAIVELAFCLRCAEVVEVVLVRLGGGAWSESALRRTILRPRVMMKRGTANTTEAPANCEILVRRMRLDGGVRECGAYQGERKPCVWMSTRALSWVCMRRGGGRHEYLREA